MTGGNAIIDPRSSYKTSAGTLRVVACTRRLALFSHPDSWALKSEASVKVLPGKNEVS